MTVSARFSRHRRLPGLEYIAVLSSISLPLPPLRGFSSFPIVL